MVTKQKRFNSLYICFDSFDSLKLGHHIILDRLAETSEWKYCVEVCKESDEQVKTEYFLIEVND